MKLIAQLAALQSVLGPVKTFGVVDPVGLRFRLPTKHQNTAEPWRCLRESHGWLPELSVAVFGVGLWVLPWAEFVFKVSLLRQYEAHDWRIGASRANKGGHYC